MSATSKAEASTLFPAPIDDMTGTFAALAHSMMASLPVTVSMASMT